VSGRRCQWAKSLGFCWRAAFIQAHALSGSLRNRLNFCMAHLTKCWLMRNATALCVNKGESAVIETVTTMRRSGESYRSIASALSEDGISTRTGGTWNPNQVRRIALRCMEC
jgi:hypothetical protein